MSGCVCVYSQSGAAWSVRVSMCVCVSVPCLLVRHRASGLCSLTSCDSAFSESNTPSPPKATGHASSSTRSTRPQTVPRDKDTQRAGSLPLPQSLLPTRLGVQSAVPQSDLAWLCSDALISSYFLNSFKAGTFRGCFIP